MQLLSFLSRVAPVLALAFVLAAGAYAQDTAPPPPPVETEGDDRAEYGAAVESAQELAAQGTADGFARAGDEYMRAAEIAAVSGDEELEVLARGATEAAVSSYADAGSTHMSQEAFADAGAHFLRAAEVAGTIDDQTLQARLTSNAGTAFLQGQQFNEAVEAFDRARELNPDNLDYAYLRAVAIRQGGDTDAAITAFEELATAAETAEDQDNVAKAHEAMGRIHLLAGRDAVQAQDWRGAISALDRAAEFLAEDDANLNTLYANAYYRLGVSQVQAEQWGAARTSLQRAQTYARTAGRDQIIQGAQQQLDYIQQVQG